MSLPELDDLITGTAVATVVTFVVTVIVKRITRAVTGWAREVLDKLAKLDQLDQFNARLVRVERKLGLDDYINRHTGGKP